MLLPICSTTCLISVLMCFAAVALRRSAGGLLFYSRRQFAITLSDLISSERDGGRGIFDLGRQPTHVCLHAIRRDQHTIRSAIRVVSSPDAGR